MDQDIELLVKQCQTCQVQPLTAPVAPLQPWEFTQHPWSQLHIDHYEYNGKTILIIMDSHSKWIEAYITNSTSSSSTVTSLRHLVSTHGLPDTIVSDNAAGFTGAEFQEFCTLNGIKHAPYHPSTNRLAERAVQTGKTGLKSLGSSDKLETQLARFLFAY